MLRQAKCSSRGRIYTCLHTHTLIHDLSDKAESGADWVHIRGALGGGSVRPHAVNGDGKLVTATTSGTTTFYVGNYYEKTGTTVRKYYYHGGRRVAMRENGLLSWPRSVSPSVWQGCWRTHRGARAWL